VCEQKKSAGRFRGERKEKRRGKRRKKKEAKKKGKKEKREVENVLCEKKMCRIVPW
jgi:hypothetical protein